MMAEADEAEAVAAHVREVRTRGFTVLPSRIPQGVAAELAAEVAGAHAEVLEAHDLEPGTPQRSRSQISWVGRFAEWVADERLLAIAREVMHDSHVRVAQVEFVGKCVGLVKATDRRTNPSHRGWHTVRVPPRCLLGVLPTSR